MRYSKVVIFLSVSFVCLVGLMWSSMSTYQKARLAHLHPITSIQNYHMLTQTCEALEQVTTLEELRAVARSSELSWGDIGQTKRFPGSVQISMEGFWGHSSCSVSVVDKKRASMSIMHHGWRFSP